MTLSPLAEHANIDCRMRMPSQPGRTWWIWNLFVWLGIGLLSATQNVFVMRSEGMHHNWTALFFDLLIGFVPWAGATPLVLLLGRQFPPVRRRSLKIWLLHSLVCLAIAAGLYEPA